MSWRRLAVLAVSSCCALPSQAYADEALHAAIEKDYQGYLAPLFEHFHRHPELSFRETATAALIAQELRSLGIRVTEGVGGTGVVGVLENGAGPTVMLRADMDGLPLEEDSGLPYASTARQVDITVRGIGAHGASPHKGKDPVYLAAQLVVALQGLVSRELSPLEPGVVTVGSIHGGTKHNIIPSEVKLQLTVRADSQETREQLLTGIRRIAEGLGRAAGLPDDLLPVVELNGESTPPTINDEALAARIRKAFARELGEDRLFTKQRDGMGAEDFAYFVQTEEHVPGLYFWVGGTPQEVLDAEAAGGPRVPSHHSPFFKIAPEPSITTGVEAMTAAVRELLAKP